MSGSTAAVAVPHADHYSTPSPSSINHPSSSPSTLPLIGTPSPEDQPHRSQGAPSRPLSPRQSAHGPSPSLISSSSLALNHGSQEASKNSWPHHGSSVSKSNGSEKLRTSSSNEPNPVHSNTQAAGELLATERAQPSQNHSYQQSYDGHLSADMSDIVPVSSAESTGTPGPTVIENPAEVIPAQPAPAVPRNTIVPYRQRQISSSSIPSLRGRASPSQSPRSSAAGSPRPQPQYTSFRRKVSRLSGIMKEGSSSTRSSGELSHLSRRYEEDHRSASQSRSPLPVSQTPPAAQPRLESPSQLECVNQTLLSGVTVGERELGSDSGLTEALDSTIERIRDMDVSIDEIRSSPAPANDQSSFPQQRSVDDTNSIYSSARTESLQSQELEYQPLHYHHSELELRARAVASEPPRHSSSTSDISRTDSLSRKSSSQRLRRPSHPAVSLVHLLNSSYPQPVPGVPSEGQTHQPTPGALASSLGHKKTFDMYLANVKKTNDPAAQYEFAVFMINSSLSQGDDVEEIVLDYKTNKKNKTDESVSKYELIREARNILQRLADRGYPFAQYHLGDGYASGFFNKGKSDLAKAFAFFVAASKHGHVESGYRAALCYEFGWGVTKDKAKAVQFYRQAASKGHPGAMLRLGKACLQGDMGQTKKYREGITWLKRAAEAADPQYNSAPYELGLLHETGFGDDVFKDLTYTAQLFTRAAELGNSDAAYRMGDAYEHGKLSCPVDPALSIHFYTTAAQAGHGPAMLALSAWFMLGSEGLLDRDYYEAYEWARKAAETGLPKACFAVGYFTEMGIGCRRDPLEANVWYVRAAEQGDARAISRLAIIRNAASSSNPKGAQPPKQVEKPKSKRFGIF
ncbi:hypothetical protein KEM54_002827 [Ascosphaera aggregata]|nr:hypothetical protein KEM54_002827 [Ascosphaera aggregata]